MRRRDGDRPHGATSRRVERESVLSSFLHAARIDVERELLRGDFDTRDRRDERENDAPADGRAGGLVVGPSFAPDEREADDVAARVVRALENPNDGKLPQGERTPPRVQRSSAFTIRRDWVPSTEFEQDAQYIATGGALRTHLDTFLNTLKAYEPLDRSGGSATIRRARLMVLQKAMDALWDIEVDGREFSEYTEKTDLGTFLERVEKGLSEREDALDDEWDKEIAHEESEQVFSDDQEKSHVKDAVGGGLNKLDEVTYSFGLDADNPLKKEKGSFVAYFKAEKEKDDEYGKHRGRAVGIPEIDPRFGDRSVAMFHLDRLLGANLVPPTFRAEHQGQKGTSMEKVTVADGSVVDGKKATQTDRENPVVTRALANLSLLDYIAGQVDRHPGNYMILKANDGAIIGVRAIDNDLAFGEGYLGAVDNIEKVASEIPNPEMKNAALATVSAGVLPSMLTEIADVAFARRIIALAAVPKMIKKALSDYLTKKEIAATVERLTRLADFLRPLIKDANQQTIKIEAK